MDPLIWRHATMKYKMRRLTGIYVSRLGWLGEDHMIPVDRPTAKTKRQWMKSQTSLSFEMG